MGKMDILPTKNSKEWDKLKNMDPLLMMKYEPITANEAEIMIKMLSGRWAETDIYVPNFRFEVADKIKDLEKKLEDFKNK